jgi:hypothetical protein
MQTYKRHYKKWSINEILQLQREHELLKLSIQEIARIHNRSIRAILCKLEKENFIDDWYEAKGFIEYGLGQPELRDYLMNDQISISSDVTTSSTDSFHSTIETEYKTIFDFISEIDDNDYCNSNNHNNNKKYYYLQTPSQIVKKFIDNCISFLTSSSTSESSQSI